MATTRRVKLECLASLHSSEHAVAFAVEAVSMGNVALKEWPAEHANDACQRGVVDQAGRQSAHLNVFVPRSGRGRDDVPLALGVLFWYAAAATVCWCASILLSTHRRKYNQVA